MSEAMRNEFEKWANICGMDLDRAERNLRNDGIRLAKGEYLSMETRFAWSAFQASRESLMIELPPKWLPVCEKGEGANEMRDACIDAIELAGLKVKS